MKIKVKFKNEGQEMCYARYILPVFFFLSMRDGFCRRMDGCGIEYREVALIRRQYI